MVKTRRRGNHSDPDSPVTPLPDQSPPPPPSKMFVVPSVMTAWVPCGCLLPNMKQPVNRGLIMLPSRLIVFIVLHWSLEMKNKNLEEPISNRIIRDFQKQTRTQQLSHVEPMRCPPHPTLPRPTPPPKYPEGFKQLPHAPVTSSQPLL